MPLLLPCMPLSYIDPKKLLVARAPIEDLLDELLIIADLLLQGIELIHRFLSGHAIGTRDAVRKAILEGYSYLEFCPNKVQ